MAQTHTCLLYLFTCIYNDAHCNLQGRIFILMTTVPVCASNSQVTEFKRLLRRFGITIAKCCCMGLVKLDLIFIKYAESRHKIWL